ncbi:hypothetical protein [uncultured Leifsonia sp.]|uniref:hypothetical protein n=1 Tax=uncultured Leifsonia sp. TaxID=340359 RepID=UPI0025D8DFA8|nr:hypothetical protein [uncultured Leifsonia sp.]
MFLDRTPASGDVTITLDSDTYVRLLRRAAEAGMSPEAFVERLTRDGYGRAIRVPGADGPGRDPLR